MTVSYVEARAEVGRRVDRFARLSAHHRKHYNEPSTRQAFILSLFRALGWNVEDVREVSPEEKVSRGFVDYSFRLGGIPRFFLETKKIVTDLDDPRWAQQTINYAWLKGVTWAVLSDFEGLKVFNAEWQEDVHNRAGYSEGYKYLTHDESPRVASSVVIRTQRSVRPSNGWVERGCSRRCAAKRRSRQPCLPL